jgi:fructosamine-3-kinase
MLLRCEQQGTLHAKHLSRFEALISQLDNIFGSEDPVLLHGDLWSGNFMCNERSQPVLIDPAVYYGHPSMDLGMTRMFGGFHSLFYEAYRYHKPFPENYEVQWRVCNLYPLLIHLYLFGPAYLSGIEDILQEFS